MLRQKIELHPVKMDLNQLVQETLPSLGGILGTVALKEDFQPLPLTSLDPEQIQVFVNLLPKRPGGCRRARRDSGSHPRG